MIYITTLDSHEYFGPFPNREQAQAYAIRTIRSSYQLTETLPEYAMKQLQAPYGIKGIA